MAGSIRDIHNAWRDNLLPASFRGALFHVEAGSMENGRRIVVHEFPKRDIPYAEDMGRRSLQFSVRGYCISFPADTSVDLYMRDYRISRDALIAQLEALGPGVLQLPTIPPVLVVCPQYRWSEEERAGGYCTFDLTFTEYGLAPSAAPESTRDNLIADSLAMRDRILTVMTGLEQSILAAAGLVPKGIAPSIQTPPPAQPSRAITHVQR